MVGLASSSVMFIDTDCDPLSAADAPETPSIVTVAVSKDELPSVSPEIQMVIHLLKQQQLQLMEFLEHQLQKVDHNQYL